MEILGIDIGGTGMKAALVDTTTGEMLTERFRLDTPPKADPDDMAEVINIMLDHFKYDGPIGLSFPTVIVNGKSMTCGNISPVWKGAEVEKIFRKKCKQKFYALNDADAAGIAEMSFGAGVGRSDGLVIMITVGTGLGSGLFYNGQLVPNFELGRMWGKDLKPVEFYASAAARKREGLSYQEWAPRFNSFLEDVVRLCHPDLLILGGGLSKRMAKFEHLLECEVPLIQAEKKNNAGIIGAALYAEQSLSAKSTNVSNKIKNLV